jgi:hypothetical protein
MLRTDLRALSALPLALGLALVPARPAHACGGMVFPEHSERVGGMREQEVMVVFQADRTVVLASAGYKGAGTGAAFLLPVRQNPLEVHEATIDVFTALDELTAPQVSIAVDDGSGEERTLCGQAGGVKDGGGGMDLGQGDDVMVLQRGSTASYDYDVIGGDTGTGVVDWLTAAGYTLPDDYAGALDPYVADGYFFLAAKIKPGVEDGAMPPLEVHLPASEVDAFSIPFGLAAHSLPPGETINITTYFVAGGGVRPVNVGVARIDPTAVRATSPEETNYQEVYADNVADGSWVLDFSEAGFDADRVLLGWDNANEFGRPLADERAATEAFLARVPFTGQRLTRLRTTLGADQLADLQLGKHAEEQDVGRDYYTTFNDDSTVCSVGRSSPINLLLFPLLLVLRRRPRR